METSKAETRVGIAGAGTAIVVDLAFGKDTAANRLNQIFFTIVWDRCYVLVEVVRRSTNWIYSKTKTSR